MSKAKNNACWMVVAINGLSRSIIPLNLPESELTKNKTKTVQEHYNRDYNTIVK